MKLYLQLLTIFFSLSWSAYPEDREDEYANFPMKFSHVFDEEGTKIEIKITMKKFDWSKHKVEYNTDRYDGEWKPATPDSPYPFRVDGKNALGTDGGVPGHELESFSVVWDGEEVKIPDSLWKDCFQLFMWSSEELNDSKNSGRWGTTQARLSESKKWLLIYSYGGGGAGSYTVTWIIPREGNPERFIHEHD